ncbi:MAG: prepilin-type N-terminal cleavage/methylation domain-containing protein [Deltaproteobacteria bacterium]|nr:prepilin-type N-terminal cleavage/methylation domain-containing protein [Deltaproteobacteria bacterium]MBW2692204.1 prepilin-type N-terminal cleavage/methylation domain-containing protein [Deltaproteobacteria bacterium]
MEIRVKRAPGRAGFTLLELMMVVTVIGVLAAIAIPLLSTYQLRSKSAEAKTNLGAIRVLEETYYSENQIYRSANAEPAAIPGSVATAFDSVNSDFELLGFVPQGYVYFSYGVAVSADGAGFTADAAADIDGDGFVQYWGYANPDSSGTKVAGKVGCDPTGLQPKSVGPCNASSGQSTF